MQWIEKVGVDSLRRSQLDVTDFVKAMLNGTIFFDELCITVACRAFNVYCVILIEGGYWSTRPNNDFSDCMLKIAYVGDFGFKELCTESALLFGEHESKDSDECSDMDKDLQDTGLLENDSTVHSAKCDSDDIANTEQMDVYTNTNNDEAHNQEQIDVKPPLMLAHCSFTTSADNPIVLSDDEQVDVKPPLILAHCSFTTSADNPIVLSDDEQVDVKPVIHAKILFTSEEAIVLLDTDTDPDTPATLTTDKQKPTKSSSTTDPKEPRYHRIKRDRNYSCYICDENFEMQSSFVAHHNEKHPDDCFKCEFCDTYYESCNGLFKHQRSHLYMKYKCKQCEKFFQFPYQLNTHVSVHTGVGKHQCSICSKSFAAKCSKDFHEKLTI